MLEYSLFDETFDKNRSDVYHIFMLFAKSGIAFIIYDPDSKKYVALKHQSLDKDLPENIYVEEVEKYIKEEEIFSVRFKKARAIYQSHKSILVPETLFDKNSLKKYFEFSYPMNDLDVIQFNKLSDVKAYNVFTIHNRVMTCLLDKIPATTFYHQATPLIISALSGQSGQPAKVMVNVCEGFFDIVVTQFGRLKLHNTFIFQNDDDILYYILFVFKQSFLDPEKTSLVLSGDTADDSSLVRLLEKYIPKISFARPDNSYTYSYKFDKVPDHQFFTLYHLINCE